MACLSLSSHKAPGIKWIQSSLNGLEVVTDKQPVPLALTFTQVADSAPQLNPSSCKRVQEQPH